ncbi:endochitinase class V/CH18 chitinase [Blumeria hordei DH14]|uniref:chitinase n=1 Tax=Blumeria graminis f. sp. hordei (strain DH14) TaxID=546991 RepID=N1JBK3_BLUG1|nr:endochitinase class V/CH18 chitinase [Blumeria hordei DH14]
MDQGEPSYRSVVYFVNWAIYGRKHFPQDLDVSKFSHILYAFANVRPDSGEVYLSDLWADQDIHFSGDSWNETGVNLFGCLKQLNLLKQKNRGLKILLSIGGWTYSANFAQPASTEEGRRKFADSAVALLLNYGFDGLDVDWEYPKCPNEAENFCLLLKACREAMDAYSSTLSDPKHFELTVACPAGPENYQIMKISEMNPYLDFWNLMAYDYAGSWSGAAAHQSNLYPSQDCPAATPFNTAQALQYYVSQGVCPSRIVLGMPLYGRAFENTDGLGKSYLGLGEGSWENGIFDYKVLPLPGSKELYDEFAQATYSYNPATRKLISYDNIFMGIEKAKWIKREGLGGAMWWESSADGLGEQSLIRAVVNNLQHIDRRNNCLEYPASKFENLRNKFQTP